MTAFAKNLALDFRTEGSLWRVCIYDSRALALRLRGAWVKDSGGYRLYWGYIRGYIGIMEKKMETTGILGIIEGIYRVYIGVQV